MRTADSLDNSLCVVSTVSFIWQFVVWSADSQLLFLFIFFCILFYCQNLLFPMPTSELIQFVNCRLVRNHALVRDDLWVRGGKIINPEPVFFDEQIQSQKKIDCGNRIIAAGYIDLQINGNEVKLFGIWLLRLFIRTILNFCAQSLQKEFTIKLTVRWF